MASLPGAEAQLASLTVLDECRFRGAYSQGLFICHCEKRGFIPAFPSDCQKCEFKEEPEVTKKQREDQEAIASHTPGVVGMAKGAVGIIKAYLGVSAPSQEVLEHRWAVCSKCDSNKLGQCAGCGCFIAEKIRVASEKCPRTPPLWDVAEVAK